MRSARGCWMMAAVLLGGGCGFKLDGFLYDRRLTDAYVFEAEGPDASSTVTPDRIEALAPIALSNGDQLGAVYVRANQSPPRAYALFFHGNGPHLEGQFAHVKRLANMGYDTLAFDYRGWGISTDRSPSPETLAEDSRAALAHLVARVGSDERIIYYGHSFGTAVVTELSVEHPPRVLVLEAPFASVQGFKEDASGMDFSWQYLALDNWETEERIKEVHSPLLILHGEEDDYVRPEFGELILANANEPKLIHIIPGAAHEVGPVLQEQHGVLVNAWVDLHLPPP